MCTRHRETETKLLPWRPLKKTQKKKKKRASEQERERRKKKNRLWLILIRIGNEMRVRSGWEDEQKYHRSAVERKVFFFTFCLVGCIIRIGKERRRSREGELSEFSLSLSLFLFFHSRTRVLYSL